MAVKRFVALYDTHGDKIDAGAARAALEFVDHFKPHVRIAGGDHVDLRRLRRGADDDEGGLTDDVNAGVEFLNALGPHVYLWGNHEKRLKDWQHGANDAYATVAHRIEEDLRKVSGKKCQHIMYRSRTGKFRLGSFTFVHGFGAGVNACRQHALSLGNMVMGHTHTPEMKVVERDDGGRTTCAVGFVSGCLRTLDPVRDEPMHGDQWLAAQRWRHGFIYGFVDEKERTHVFHAYPVGGTWFFPTEWHST